MNPLLLLLCNVMKNTKHVLADSLAMEDSFVALMNDTLVTPQARRRAERSPTNTTRELHNEQHAHTHTQKEIRQRRH